MRKKALRKIISFLISAAMLMISLPNASLANQTNELNNEEYKLLSALGVLRQYPSFSTITRGEFAQIGIRLCGIDDSSIAIYNGVDYFSDIADSPYRAAINAAASYGFVTGYEGENSSKFYPNNEITGEEATSIIVKVLGYGPEIEARKIAASIKATELGLAKDVTLNKNLNSSEMVNLLYDALDTKIYKMDSFGTDVTMKKGDTALYEYFDVVKIEGIVTNNSVSGLKNNDGVGKNNVAIDKTTYSTDISDIAYLLGYRVEALVQNKDGEQTVIYANPVKNKIISATADNIDASTSIDKFIYMSESGKMKTQTISPTISVVFNANMCPSYDDTIFKPNNGKVTLIDNDSDSIYDVAVVESYHDYVVSGADGEKLSLYDRYGRTPIENSEAEISVIKDGATVSFSAIAQGNVVSVYDGGDIIKMVISSYANIEGTIEQMSDDDGKIYVGIGGKEYQVNSDYMELQDGKRIKPQLDLEGIFSLNFEGKISSIEKKMSSKEKYALITKVGNNGVLSDSVEVKVFLTDGNWRILSLAERCNLVCGNTVIKRNINAETVKNLLGYIDGTTDIKPQPVRFKQNSTGEISELNIAPNGTIEPMNSDEEIFSRNDILTATTYNTTSHIYGRWLCLQDTVIFGVPDYKNGAELDEENFAVYFYNSLSGKYDGEVYASSKYNVAGAVVLYDVPGKITYSGQNSLIAVERIANSHDSNGEDMTVIYGTMGSRHKQYTSKDNMMFNEVKKGDIIQIRMDADRRKVLSVRTVYRDIDVDFDLYNGPVISNPTSQDEVDANQKHMIYKNTYVKRAIWNYPNTTTVITGDLTTCTLVHGYLLWKDDAYITVAYPYESRDTSAVNIDGMVIRSYPVSDSVKVGRYICSGSKRSIQSDDVSSLVPGSSAAAMDGSELLINTLNGRVDEIWIFDRNN